MINHIEEGYLDGRKDGAYSFKKAIEPYVDKIKKDIADLEEEECNALEKEMEM